MNIVYIPQHLFPALKKAKLRSQDLRDVEKLLGTLSADDVAFYLFANDSRHCPLPKSLTDSLPNLLFGGVMPWVDTPGCKNVLGKFNSMILNGTSAVMYEDNAVLTSDCEEEDLLILTHTAATDAEVGENSISHETALYDRIVQQLLVFRPLNQVLAMPLVAGWMKSVQASA